MTTKTINTATAPDGATFTRTSSSGRAYSHTVLYRRDNGWHASTWHSRRDLAERERSRTGWHESVREILVVPVTATEKAVKAKPMVHVPPAPFEIGGLTFLPKAHGVWATYRNFMIELWSTGTAFVAWATFDPSRQQIGVKRLYTAKGGLETRVTAIKAMIDAYLAAEAEKAPSA
jgi:hypothetical protein